MKDADRFIIYLCVCVCVCVRVCVCVYECAQVSELDHDFIVH